MKKILLLVICILSIGTFSYGQGTEDCANMCTSSCSPASSSYGSRSWSGTTAGTTVDATDARTDQDITGQAICFRAGGVVISGISGGIGTVCFNYSRAFTTGTGTIGIFNNGVQVGSSFSVTSGTTMQACVDFDDATATSIEISRLTASGTLRTIVDDITWTSFVPPLPVALTSFSAEPKGKKVVELTWTTASEISNDYFILEYSKDGSKFSELTMVDGAGNSDATNYYSYMHETPAKGKNYYRLRQVDYNGAINYSDVQVANLGGKNAFKINPTFAKNTVQLVLPEATTELGNVSIYDLTGNLVNELTLERGAINKSLNIADLQAGHYMVRLQTGYDFQTARFIKL